MDDHLDQIKAAIIDGKHNEIENFIKAAIEGDTNLDEIINNAMIPAMDTVGNRFVDNEIFVPEMLVSAVTMKKGLALINPLLKGHGFQSMGKIIMCTVKGDLHDIGKNLVIMMLEGAGFRVIDLGIDVAVETVIQKVDEIKPDILGLSALLTTTMPEMKKVIEALTVHGLRSGVTIMVGGAPIDGRFAKEIGADGYGKDAPEAVMLSRRFVSAN